MALISGDQAAEHRSIAQVMKALRMQEVDFDLSDTVARIGSGSLVLPQGFICVTTMALTSFVTFRD